MGKELVNIMSSKSNEEDIIHKKNNSVIEYFKNKIKEVEINEINNSSYLKYSNAFKNQRSALNLFASNRYKNTLKDGFINHFKYNNQKNYTRRNINNTNNHLNDSKTKSKKLLDYTILKSKQYNTSYYEYNMESNFVNQNNKLIVNNNSSNISKDGFVNNINRNVDNDNNNNNHNNNCNKNDNLENKFKNNTISYNVLDNKDNCYSNYKNNLFYFKTYKSFYNKAYHTPNEQLNLEHNKNYNTKSFNNSNDKLFNKIENKNGLKINKIKEHPIINKRYNSTSNVLNNKQIKYNSVFDNSLDYKLINKNNIFKNTNSYINDNLYYKALERRYHKENALNKIRIKQKNEIERQNIGVPNVNKTSIRLLNLKYGNDIKPFYTIFPNNIKSLKTLNKLSLETTKNNNNFKKRQNNCRSLNKAGLLNIKPCKNFDENEFIKWNDNNKKWYNLKTNKLMIKRSQSMINNKIILNNYFKPKLYSNNVKYLSSLNNNNNNSNSTNLIQDTFTTNDESKYFDIKKDEFNINNINNQRKLIINSRKYINNNNIGIYMQSYNNYFYNRKNILNKRYNNYSFTPKINNKTYFEISNIKSNSNRQKFDRITYKKIEEINMFHLKSLLNNKKLNNNSFKSLECNRTKTINNNTNNIKDLKSSNNSNKKFNKLILTDTINNKCNNIGYFRNRYQINSRENNNTNIFVCL